MLTLKIKAIVLSFAALAALSVSSFGQSKPGDGTESQRLDVMRAKLETMKRSLTGAASGIKQENKEDKIKKGDKENTLQYSCRDHA